MGWWIKLSVNGDLLERHPSPTLFQRQVGAHLERYVAHSERYIAHFEGYVAHFVVILSAQNGGAQ